MLGAVKHLSRDELAELIGVKQSTMGVWRHRKLIGPPSTPGTTGHQSQYDADTSFEAYCFAIAAASPNIRLEGAATISRYLRARQGTVRLLYSYWPEPITLQICPTFDLAAFEPAGRLLYDTVVRAYRAVHDRIESFKEPDGRFIMHPASVPWQVAEELPVAYLLSQLQLGPSGILDQEGIDQMRAHEEESGPEHSAMNARGALAGRIFRNQKAVQYGDVPRHATNQGVLDQLDLSGISLEQLLLAEGWAIAFLDDVLYFNGLKGRSEHSDIPVYSLEVTDAVDRIGSRFDIEKLPLRTLKEPPPN